MYIVLLKKTLTEFLSDTLGVHTLPRAILTRSLCYMYTFSKHIIRL